MMSRFFIFLALTLVTSAISLAAPKIYSDPRQAIEAAKGDGKLIVFLLADSFSPESKAVEEAVLDQTKDLEKEFVIARCSAGSQVHRTMFTERFKKDVSRAPVAVVSDAKGQEITGCYGIKPSIYRKMLSMARIKGGFVTNKQEIAELRAGIVDGEDEEELVKSIFGIKLSDLRGTQVAMTDIRKWNYRTGGGFTAALLEGKGENGVFLNKAGERIEVKFADLTDADIEFLGTILRGGKTEESN